MATDTISYKTASDIDRSWSDARWPSDGLRIVPLKNETLLAVPDTDDAPLYNWRSHDPETGDFNPAFYHVAGPALAEWQARQRNAQIALDNARRYTEQAADSAAQAEQLPEPHKGWANSNAALFTEKAAFFTAQAAEIAAR